MSRETTRTSRNLPGRIFITALLFGLASAHAVPYPGAEIRDFTSCNKLEEIPLDATTRFSGGETQQCFELSMARAGYLTLDVSTRISSGIELHIELVTHSCHMRDTRDYRWIERSATSVLLATGPWTHTFCVAPQDPRDRLPEFKISTAALELDFAKGGDPLVIEPDPDPFADCSSSSDDPDCATKQRLSVLRRQWTKLCRSVDDHGDSPACATPLAKEHLTPGELDNEWGDDADLFTFALSEMQTVSIVTQSDGDTMGALYDRYGHRLAFDDDAGDGDNFRIVKTLAAGRYFVTVQSGSRGAAKYQLQVGKPVR